MTLNIQDAYNDDRFQPKVDLRTGYRTRSILCVPMRDSLGQIAAKTGIPKTSLHRYLAPAPAMTQG